MDWNKPLADWTFEELVRYNQGKILLEIPTGKFNEAVWAACDLALRWKAEHAAKRETK